MADEDMPDLDLLAGVLPAETAPPAAAAAPSAANEGLDEEDELELALEAELEAEADMQREAAQQAAQPPPLAQQQPALAAPAPASGAVQDAARAGAAAAAALQQEEDEQLPLTADGFIDLDRLTAKQHQRYNTLVSEMLSEHQLDRYSAFRRSNLRKPMQLLMSKTLGGAPNQKALIALSSVTKSFVDDLVAAAMAVAEERGESTPLQPAHIHAAYQRLIEQDKVPGKTPRRRAFL
ncbi:hypothetical protein ABPG75_000505 [Micractinium tetrahymenae]